ncbi:hypothetical protein ABZS95_26695 [Streptomyces sp. NPDC005479]|uniref:hypothetical protein n=1 Tax=Streptomyces sp. NPDC005479 TaxID=3154879 RepID=UPI0033A54621
MVLEYQVEFGEWDLKRVEATGPLCQSDGDPVPDSDDTHIHSWLTPLRPTRANPDGVPDWVVTLGRRYMPRHLNDPTTEQ